MAPGRKGLSDRYCAEGLAARDQAVFVWGDERGVERVVIDERLTSVAQGKCPIARLGQNVLLAEAAEDLREEFAFDATEGGPIGTALDKDP